MTTTQESIGKLALSHLGVSKPIRSIATGVLLEEIAIRNVFDIQRDYVLRAFPWPFATEYVTLGDVEGTSATAVNGDWQYSYAYPAGCLYLRRLVGANGRNDPNPPPFVIGRNPEGRVIFTNEADAVAEFTAQITDVTQFDPIFIEALAWRIAAVIAPAMGKIKGMIDGAYQMYEYEIAQAKLMAQNESQPAPPLESEFIRCRD